MRKSVLGATVAAALGSFYLAGVASAPATAQDKPAAKQQMNKPADKAATAKKAAPSKQVMAVQEALNRNGAKLKVDGLMGNQTREALRAYQKANKLEVTGRPDRATLAKLGI